MRELPYERAYDKSGEMDDGRGFGLGGFVSHFSLSESVKLALMDKEKLITYQVRAGRL